MVNTGLKIRSRFLFLLLPLILLVFVFVYLYKEKYSSCLTKDLSLCINSKRYVSANGEFSFRYPKDYPITFITGRDLMTTYGYEDKYVEWVNFSSVFYPNAGGDRLGDIIVEKNTPFKNVKDYAANELSGFKIPPEIVYSQIAGKDAACSSLKQQPHSFTSPSYDCFIIFKGYLYRISFDYNDYYHKLPTEYYEKAKQLILSTFTIK